MKWILSLVCLILSPSMLMGVCNDIPLESAEAFDLTVDQVIAKTCKPYNGKSNPSVDRNTLVGKVMCGYQGWFACKGDGSGRGWYHWEEPIDNSLRQKGKIGKFRPGHCTIDIWPDVSDLDEDEKYPTDFKHADGSVAYVYSSLNRKTVERHYKWMRDYSIDGTMVQRYVVATGKPKDLYHFNTVLANCRSGANVYGRCYAIMYDLSGMTSKDVSHVKADWKMLVDKMRLTRDPKDKAYLHHKGKPLIGIWGVGFNDSRKYNLDDCAELVDFFKNDPQYGGMTVLLGVPAFWRTLGGDSLADKKLHDIILKADVVSPWLVGRFADINGIDDFYNTVFKDDVLWCKEKGKDYLPVAWPGFSWSNLMKGKSGLDIIPRLKGKFLWQQYVAFKKAGANMVYQAMFDEVDEGTAIFKCTNDPPVGESKFITYEGLPSDHYLWLVAKGRELIRSKNVANFDMPIRSD